MTTESLSLLALLAHHQHFNSEEQQALVTARAFIERTPSPCTRSTLEGHVTGSAMVLDRADRALLLFHKQLHLWVQPGGHLEPGEGPFEAALRESTEESGLLDLQLELAATGQPRLLDIDVHPIPESARKREPAHFHHDFCFLARTSQPEALQIDPNESKGFRWVSPHELESIEIDHVTRRRLQKAWLAR